MSVVAEKQAPLRSSYTQDPAEALTRKHARTSASRISPTDPFHGEVEIGRGYGTSLQYGLDRYVGGLHDLPNPGDILCAALAACQDGTIRMVADLLGIRLEELEVEVSGELDVRGALAVDPDVRVGFEALDCRVRLRAAPGTGPRRVERLVAAAERYCVNMDTLRGGVRVEVETELEEENEEKAANDAVHRHQGDRGSLHARGEA